MQNSISDIQLSVGALNDGRHFRNLHDYQQRWPLQQLWVWVEPRSVNKLP